MIDDNLITREDKKYKTIELYKKYEFTYSVCYEMAVRNSDVINILEQMQDIEHTLEELGISPHLNTSNKNVEMQDKFSSLRKKLIDDFYFALTPLDLLYNRDIFIDKEKKTSKELIEYAVGDAKHNNKLLLETPIDSNRLPTIPKNKSRRENISIDFALPIQEIIDTITEIKKHYDEYNKLINSEIEEIMKNNKIYNKRVNYLNAAKIVKYIQIPDKTKQQLCADMFFIYDTAKQNSNNLDKDCIEYIQNELLNYYTDYILTKNNFEDEVIKEKTSFAIYDSVIKMDVTTIKGYYNMMKKYIDNLEYKALLT